MFFLTVKKDEKSRQNARSLYAFIIPPNPFFVKKNLNSRSNFGQMHKGCSVYRAKQKEHLYNLTLDKAVDFMIWKFFPTKKYQPKL